MGQEVTINGSADPRARYVTFAPSPCTIRQTGRRTPHLEVVLSSRPARQGGGELVFYPPDGGPSQEQLRLQLPPSGAPVSFAVGGRWQRPSIEDGDCLLVATPVGAAGETETTIPLMVRVRKNANELTAAERDRFLAAMGRLNDSGRGVYADFRAMHVSAANSQEHGGPQFLPWHRAYLLDLERELQEIDPSVSLHYWRWDLASPNVFQRNFMGVAGIDGYVEFTPDHPFNGWTTDGQVGILRRPLFVTILPAPLPRNEQQTLATGDKYPEFRQMEGNPHGWAHVSFDGWINSIPTAAKDPLFFMLHSNVDRLWALWQWVNRRTDPVQPDVYTGEDQDGRRLGDTLWPWNGEQGRVNPPFAPGGTFPPSLLVPAPGDVPLLRSTIDFQGHTDPIDRHGYGYDTVPYEFA